MEFLATILSAFGSLTANTNSKACALVMLDEPECPQSLIK